MKNNTLQNKITTFLFILLFFISSNLFSQQGGSHIFSFLNQPPSTFAHSQGGIMISNATNDITTALQNPATLSELTRNAISFNHTFHFSGISTGYFSYGNYWKKKKLEWHTGIQYTNYGTFIGADEWGNKTADFKAADYAFIVGATRHLNDRFHVGVNTKFIYSRLESYIATGIGFDIGGFYKINDKNAAIGVVIKNLGFVTKAYTDKGGLLPFDLQVGFSKKLKHLPFRYNITAHHLYKWNVRYYDPLLLESTSLFEENREPSLFNKFSDNLFRHLIFGGEFLLGKKENLKVRFAYNHMQGRELSVANVRYFNGFSGGVELKVKHFFIGYSMGVQHVHGNIKQLSITTNFSRFKKK